MQTESPDTTTPAPPRRGKWLAGGGLLAAGVIGLAAWAAATPGAVSYFATPSEVAVQGDAAMGRTLRVGGRVAKLDRDGTVVRFTVTDGSNDLDVHYAGEVPDTLRERTDVIAEGTLAADGTLHATRVLAKCSSKFVPADEMDEHFGAG